MSLRRTAPVLEVRRLGKTFAGRSPDGSIPVLDGVTFDVRRGEFVCIVGASGCGKSTLLNIVAGFAEATAGEVLVEGEPVRGPDPRRVYVFQDSAVFPWLTVRQNIAFGVRARGAAERAAVVARYVAMVGLGGFEDARPHQLSGGMKQRVQIARALAANPDIVYMDEPFGALDFLTRMKVRSDVVRIWETERKTILFVTHDIEEAVHLADRVIVLTARPARVQEIVAIELPRPRSLESPGFLAARQRLYAAIGLGAGAAAAPESAASPARHRSSDGSAIACPLRPSEPDVAASSADRHPRGGICSLA